jgi:DNA-binding transcriptional regulator of glucitol operon
VAAFICSLVGLWIAGIPLGLHAQRQIDKSSGRLTGRGFASAGVVLGLLSVLGTVVLLIALAHVGTE